MAFDKKAYMRAYHKAYVSDPVRRAEASERGKKWYARNRERVRAERKNNPEKFRQSDRRRNQAIKLEALSAYAVNPSLPYCCWCNDPDTDALEIDHVDNDGFQHRKKTGSGSRFYYWLKQHNWPTTPRLQVLCASCNRSKLVNGGVLSPKRRNLFPLPGSGSMAYSKKLAIHIDHILAHPAAVKTMVQTAEVIAIVPSLSIDYLAELVAAQDRLNSAIGTMLYCVSTPLKDFVLVTPNQLAGGERYEKTV